MSPLPALLAVLAASGCAAAAQVPLVPGPGSGSTGKPLGIRSEPLPPPAPQGAPEAEEAAAALADGSSTALIQFLARHPDDRAAPRVRAALAARTAPDDAARTAAAGEAEIVAAFDAARRDGSAAAWEAFAARFRGHPLVAEAEAWR